MDKYEVLYVEYRKQSVGGSLVKRASNVELAHCYSDGTWLPGNFVDIPANTPTDKIAEVAIAESQMKLSNFDVPIENLKGEEIEVVGMWLYNSYDDDVDC